MAAVLHRYPQVATTTPVITRMPGGANTAPWLVTGPAGGFVLRRLPGYLSPERARFAAAVHDHAAGALEVVPAVLANDTGDLVTEHGGHRYLLTRRAPGTPLGQHVPTPARCHELGAVLGRLHQRLREMPLPADAPRQRISADVTAGIRAAAAAHARCDHRSARQILGVKLRRAAALRPENLAVLRDLPVALVHGDMHPGNILTVGGRVSGILDFDLTRLAPPAYELARALLYCIHPAGPSTVYGPRVGAFLTDYLAVSPLRRHELATMAQLYETTQILDTFGLAACDDATPALLAFGHARFALLYWLRRDSHALTALALQAHQALAAEAGSR
ncbi:MAG: phosphotransferase [Pseudonocardiales bacterium]